MSRVFRAAVSRCRSIPATPRTNRRQRPQIGRKRESGDFGRRGGPHREQLCRRRECACELGRKLRRQVRVELLWSAPTETTAETKLRVPVRAQLRRIVVALRGGDL